MEFAPGTRVSHFKVLEKIGEGGMGEVYLAEDESLERRVALKVLSEECCRESERLQRFIREAKASSALNHPNIITIFEFGMVGAAHFIASEYIEGRTLGEILIHGALSLDESLKIAGQVASALATAHAAGIVHRDIKPDNVMVRPDGIVKVLDFGVAKLLEGKSAVAVRKEDPTKLKVDTSPGMIIGTANYMSPEQAAGKPVDTRSDIFSFGLLLYELVSGRPPFDGDTAVEKLAAVLYKEAEPLGSLAPDAPPELCSIISKAMSKDPDDRYGSMSDLMRELAPLSAMDVTSFTGSSGRIGRTEEVTRILEAPVTGETLPPEATKKTVERTNQFAPSHLKYWLAAALVLAGITAGGLWYALRDVGGEIDTVAVLPFLSREEGEEAEALADGMTESLISGLSRLPGLTVRARSSVFRFKGSESEPAKAAAELNVRALVMGRITNEGEQMSLYVEVLDTQLDKVIWSERFTGPQSDIASIRSNIVRRVSDTLRSSVASEDKNVAANSGTKDAEAFRLYLRGRYFWNQRTGAALLKAEELYKKAIDRDPAFAQAYAGLAETYAIQHFYSASTPDVSLPKAEAAARKALEIDDSVAEAHTALGFFLFYYKWDAEGAEREMRRSIELNPNYATGYHWLGNAVLVSMGRIDEAVEAGEKAEELDPLSPIVVTDTAYNLYMGRRYEEALKKLAEAESLDPNFFYTKWVKGLINYVRGRYEEAEDNFRETLKLDDDPYTRAVLACALVKSGKRSEALQILKELETKPSRYLSPSAFALMYGTLGDMDKAMEYVDKDLAEKSDNPFGRSIEPLFDDLRRDPRFDEIITKYKRMAPLQESTER